MKHTISILLLLAGGMATTHAAGTSNEPHIGYLYPAGGTRGANLVVHVGGQLLRDSKAVHVSGEGVNASIIRYFKPIRNLQSEEREELIRQLVESKQKRLSELPGEDKGAYEPLPGENRYKKLRSTKTNKDGGDSGKEPTQLPEVPLLWNLQNKSLREIYHIASVLLDFDLLEKRQLNRQFMETVLLKVTIDADAAPGMRELRLITAQGLTNPMRFEIGAWPEVSECEPNDRRGPARLPEAPPLALPVVVNGQILPGDIDRFRFQARAGQELVLHANARGLIPFLADAVPGWFQATVAVYDSEGRELAFADDFRFHPDPVLFFRVPRNGTYELEIRDALYRGREDFVYRIELGERPFVSSIFPLSGSVGSATVVAVQGSHLSSTRFKLDTRAGGPPMRESMWGPKSSMPNQIVYAVDDLPTDLETEPNDESARAQALGLPRAVNGRIGRSGDVDLFSFQGKAGDQIVAELTARRLQSPLDGLLRVLDDKGQVLAWNDDRVIKQGHLHLDLGILTHHADPYVQVQLPRDGMYYVQVRDTSSQGSEAHAYRLRVSRPIPDFSVCIAPSSLTIPLQGTTLFTAYALRRDGFEGDIELHLVGAPDGFELSGALIPAGVDSVRVTLSASQQPARNPVSLQVEGQARMAETLIRHPADPCDDVMQAFLWRHLVPAEELLVHCKISKKPLPLFRVAGGRALLSSGETKSIHINGPNRPEWSKGALRLNSPPEGIMLQGHKWTRAGIEILLKVDDNTRVVPENGNLVIDIVEDRTLQSKKNEDQKPVTAQKIEAVIGMLPAIPYKIQPPNWATGELSIQRKP